MDGDHKLHNNYVFCMSRMVKIFFLFILTGTPCILLQAQKDTILRRIILIGDGGELHNGHHTVAEAVRKTITLDKKTSIIFLGDNIYEHGLPDIESSLFEAGRAVLDSQLAIADNTDAHVYMIPGNHDWHNGKRDGYEAILREQFFAYQAGKKNVDFYPQDGCPGPVEISLGDEVTLILFDSQWWLHPYDKPELESDCFCKTKEELLAQIEDIIKRNYKKLVVIASHHPFKSLGPHGGYYPLKQHIFPLTDISPKLYIPLPVIGSIYPIARGVFGTPQDLRHPNYQNMVRSISDIAREHPHVVFAAGHEHTLQLLQDSSFHYIVSGSGCKRNRVSKNKSTLYAADTVGFAVMEISVNKDVNVQFYTVTDTVHLSSSNRILNFSDTSVAFNKPLEEP